MDEKRVFPSDVFDQDAREFLAKAVTVGCHPCPRRLGSSSSESTPISSRPTRV